MKITSPAFTQNDRVPERYTCVGTNVNPPLHFEDIPPETKSMVLLLEDPDAPTKTFTHWLVYDIPPTTSQVPENAGVRGAVGKNDFGSLGYGGPCPPSGTHHYHFKLYALDTQLNLPEGSSRKVVFDRIKNHILDQAELVALFSKKGQ